MTPRPKPTTDDIIRALHKLSQAECDVTPIIVRLQAELAKAMTAAAPLPPMPHNAQRRTGRAIHAHHQ